MTLPRRFDILPFYGRSLLQANEPRAPLADVWRYLSRAGKEKRGRSWIKRMVEEGAWRKIWLRGIADPLWFPVEEDFTELCAVIDEQLDARNWHFYETPETPLRPDDIVVDCGAAEGLFSLVAAGRSQQVYAVEPLPKFIHAMERTFAPLANVKIVPYALSDKVSTAHFADHAFASGVSTAGVEVQVSTIDVLFATVPVSYLKADVEGFESNLLRGARETIRKHKPRIAITTYHPQNNVQEMEELLQSYRPDYRFRRKGISSLGTSVMLHAW